MNTASVPSKPFKVVLLHGLARSHLSMKPLQKKLHAAGYETLNIHYDSRHQDIQGCSEQVYSTIQKNGWLTKSLIFVTHSLGGIITRYLAHHHNILFEKVVMLGPPNRGAGLVDGFPFPTLLQRIFGQPALQLTTHSPLLKQLPLPCDNTAVIAGNSPFHLLNPSSYYNCLRGNTLDHDGTVEVLNTQMEGLSDFIEIKTHHTFMMWNSQVIQQVLHYLEHGHFNRNSRLPTPDSRLRD